jgi:hypothetical protein
LTSEPEEPLEQEGADRFRAEAFGEVAERAVENAALPVVANPGEIEIAIRAVNAGGGQINRVGVECEEHTNPIPREGPELVELLGEAEGW